MSLANLLRPRCIADVKGQKQVTDVLSAQIRDNRLAQCMILSGKFGCGKTSVARVIAASVTCDHPKANGDPCGKCPSCRSIRENGSNVNVVELDAATYRGIDAVRSVIEQAQIPPQGLAKKKVIVLDECHMLTVEASNALLKTLEEPPEWCIFILCTTEEQRILPTIKSRCQVFLFEPIREETMSQTVLKVLQEQQISFEERVPDVIAHLAHGSFRNALSSLEQCICSLGPGEKLTVKEVSMIMGIASMDAAYSVLAACIDADIPSIMYYLTQARCDGTTARGFLDALCEMFLDALCQASGMEQNNGYDMSFLEFGDISYLCELISALGELRGKLSSYSEPFIQLTAVIVKIVASVADPGIMQDTINPVQPLPVIEKTEIKGDAQELPEGFSPVNENDQIPFEDAVSADDFFGTNKECARRDNTDGDELSGGSIKKQDCTGTCATGQEKSEPESDGFGFTGFAGLGF